MSKKIVILFILVGIIILPIAFRRSSGSALKGEDTLVVISAHPESNQAEFKRAFSNWYFKKTGKSIKIDWRYPGGLSDILRLVDALFDNAFRFYWENDLKKTWTPEVEYGYCAPSDKNLSTQGIEAYETFRASNIGCGIDVFFGAGGQELGLQKNKGRFVVPKIVQKNPEWFTDEVYPLKDGGFFLRDPDLCWFGVVFSSYGIAYNEDLLHSLKIHKPNSWKDLASPKYFGELALADPTKSGSVKQAMEMIIQSAMQRNYRDRIQDGLSKEEASAIALENGWIEGMQLLQKMSANTRYFTEKSNRPIMSVASGNCAAAMALDFAAFSQIENLKARSSDCPFKFVPPKEGSAFTPDGIALFRGAPNPDTAEAFIEFILSPEGQALWGLKAGTPNGPEEYTLHRFPIRKDFYYDENLKPHRADPEFNPYHEMLNFPYEASWTEPLLSVFHKVIRAVFIDPQEELRAAWRAIQDAYETGDHANGARAELIMSDFTNLPYSVVTGKLKAVLSDKDPMKQITILSELTNHFLAQYKQAREVALGLNKE